MPGCAAARPVEHAAATACRAPCEVCCGRLIPGRMKIAQGAARQHPPAQTHQAAARGRQRQPALAQQQAVAAGWCTSSNSAQAGGCSSCREGVGCHPPWQQVQALKYVQHQQHCTHHRRPGGSLAPALLPLCPGLLRYEQTSASIDSGRTVHRH